MFNQLDNSKALLIFGSYSITGHDEISNVVSNKTSQFGGRASDAASTTRSRHRGSVHSNQKIKESKSNRSINVMVMSISFFYVIGTVPYSVIFILSQLMTVSDLTQLYAIVALNLFHGSNIFMFYAFNKLYRQTLNKYIRNVLGLILPI